MTDIKLEFKVIRDSKDNDVELNSMSVEAAQAFLILAESVTRIIELTPNNEELRIQIKKGSATVAVSGGEVETVAKDFTTIVNSKSTDKGLVEQWRKIQTLFAKNGLQYEANIYTRDETIEVFKILKKTKRLRTKSQYKPAIQTNICFMTGKLIAVGGKIPNIHIETEDLGRLTISCTEKNAKKAKAFLYSKILLSAWVKESGETKNYELCDSYFENQLELFNDLSLFISSMREQDDEIESLKLLHYECRKYLDENNYGFFRKLLRLFIHESIDVNILKTILIITQSFKEKEELKEMRASVQSLFDSKIHKLKSKN
jgi:hypothetical protein